MTPIPLFQWLWGVPLSLEFHRADTNPWATPDVQANPDFTHFRCVLTHRDRPGQVACWVSILAAGEATPCVTMALDVLAVQCETLELATSYESWCTDVHRDADHSQTIQMYLAWREQRERARALFGRHNYARLLDETIPAC